VDIETAPTIWGSFLTHQRAAYQGKLILWTRSSWRVPGSTGSPMKRCSTPTAIQSARLLEIGVANAEGIDFIVHAMPARPRFLE